MSFSKQMEQFAKKANRSVEQTIRGTAIKLFSAVISGSPVDTGRFRANWMIGGAMPAGGVTSDTDKSGSKTVNSMASYVNSAITVDSFTLSNNLPYARTIEFGGYPGDGPETIGGYSKQAPQGVVRVNVSRFERILNEEARKNR